jgi:hypothetical protein
VIFRTYYNGVESGIISELKRTVSECYAPDLQGVGQGCVGALGALCVVSGWVDTETARVVMHLPLLLTPGIKMES